VYVRIKRPDDQTTKERTFGVPIVVVVVVVVKTVGVSLRIRRRSLAVERTKEIKNKMK
jgi:hypothetical protein